MDRVIAGVVFLFAAVAHANEPMPNGPGALEPPGSEAPAPPEDRGQALRAAGLAGAVLSVVAVSVGTYYLLRTEELEDKAEHVVLEVGESDPYEDEGKRAEVLGFTFTIGGVALGVASAIVYVVGEHRRGEPTVAVTPNGATLGWKTEF